MTLPPSQRGISPEELDQYSRFLRPTLPKGNVEYYDQRIQLLGKELSVANLDKPDILSYIKMSATAKEMLRFGQDELSLDIQVDFVIELKLTMSKDGKVIEYLLSNKMEYVQTQNITEQIKREQRQSLWGKKKGD